MIRSQHMGTLLGFATASIAVAFAAACGATAPTPTTTPTPTAVPMPTATPLPSPTPTPEPTPSALTAAMAAEQLPAIGSGRDYELVNTQEWLNGTPTTISALRDAGEVVLVDFWTYT